MSLGEVSENRSLIRQQVLNYPSTVESTSPYQETVGRVSIILPAYNEAQLIHKTIVSVKDFFRPLCPNYEIIVVDDGSIDETRSIATTPKDTTVRVIGYDRNQGKGHALKVGSRFVTGEIVFLLDSDSEIWPRGLEDYLMALNVADLVIGSKRHSLSSVEAPIIRKFLSLGFNLIERILTGIKARDTQTGLKVAKAQALNEIMPLLSVKRYAFDVELLTVASLLRLRIVELPVQVRLRAGFSTREVFRMLIDLLGITYRLRIKHWYQKKIAARVVPQASR